MALRYHGLALAVVIGAVGLLVAVPAPSQRLASVRYSTAIIEANGLSSFQIKSAFAGGHKLEAGASSASVCNEIAFASAQPCGRLWFTPATAPDNSLNMLALGASNGRVLIQAKCEAPSACAGGAIEPFIVLADHGTYGVPLWHGGNGTGITFGGKAGSGQQLNFNFVNLGKPAANGSMTGIAGSTMVNIIGGSVNGDTQNAINFFNYTGCQHWLETVCSGTPAGARLGEIAFFGTVPGVFGAQGVNAETESGSWNAYSDQAFTGSAAEYSYSAPTNLIARVAYAMLPQSVVGGFYNPGTFALGEWSHYGNAFTSGNGTLTFKDGGTVSGTKAGATILSSASGKFKATSPTVGTSVNVVTQSGSATTDAPACWAGDGQTKTCGVWTSYTPTVTAAAGTITTLGTVVGRFARYGGTVHARLEIPITTNGTANGGITATLPVNASSANGNFYAGTGRDQGFSNNMLSVMAYGGQVDILNYNASYPGGDGARLVVSIEYEAAP